MAILGEGISSRFETRDAECLENLRVLRERSRRVGELLGAVDVVCHDLPDNRFDTVALLDVTRLVEDLIGRLDPDTVLTHHGGDLNVDHRVVHRAVVTATRPVPGSRVAEVLAFETPSSTEWAFGSAGASFCPNVFYDIADTLDTKLRAMAIYDGEIRTYPHPRSTEALEAIANRWGSVAGMSAAEAFVLVRRLLPRCGAPRGR